MGVERKWAILGIVSLISLGFTTTSYAVPPENPGEPFEELMTKLNEMDARLQQIEQDVSTIKGTVSEPFEITVSIPNGLPAQKIMLYGECQSGPQENCSFFTVNKINVPSIEDRDNLTSFPLLCIDNFACSLLGDKSIPFSLGINAGVAIGPEVTLAFKQSYLPPPMPILPTNLLFASGLGQISAKNLVSIGSYPAYDESLTFIGEKPLDMQIVGAYKKGSDLFCFDMDGASISCPQGLTDKISVFSCTDVGLFTSFKPESFINQIELQNLNQIQKSSELNTTCTLCTDGTIDCPGSEDQGVPFITGGQLCYVYPTKISCEPLSIDFTGIAPQNILDKLDVNKAKIESNNGILNVIKDLVDSLIP